MFENMIPLIFTHFWLPLTIETLLNNLSSMYYFLMIYNTLFYSQKCNDYLNLLPLNSLQTTLHTFLKKSSYYKTNLGMNQPKKKKIRNVCRDRQPPHDFHLFCNVDQNVNCQKIWLNVTIFVRNHFKNLVRNSHMPVKISEFCNIE